MGIALRFIRFNASTSRAIHEFSILDLTNLAAIEPSRALINTAIIAFQHQAPFCFIFLAMLFCALWFARFKYAGVASIIPIDTLRSRSEVWYIVSGNAFGFSFYLTL